MDIQRPPNRKRRYARVAVFAVVAAGAIFLMIVAWNVASQPPGLDGDEFLTARVRAAEFIHEVTARGVIYAPEIRSVTNKSGGVVEVIHVLAGHEVEPDTLLMELSSPNLEQELADAETALETAKADEFLRQAQADDEFLNLQSSLADIKATYETAALEADAEEMLYAEGASSELDRARKKNAADQQFRRMEIAQQKVDRYPEMARARDEAAQAKLDQQQRKVDRLLERVADLQVRAGVAGVVQAVMTEEGRRLGDGSEVARVINPDYLIARINVSERDAQLVELGQPVRLELGRESALEGRVERIDPAVKSRLVEVDVELVGEAGRQLRPDLSVVGRILVGRVPDTLVVERPTGLRDDQTEAQIFRLISGGQRAERSRITIGRISALEVEVLSGLEAGDEIITSNMDDWIEESVVRIR